MYQNFTQLCKTLHNFNKSLHKKLHTTRQHSTQLLQHFSIIYKTIQNYTRLHTLNTTILNYTKYTQLCTIWLKVYTFWHNFKHTKFYTTLQSFTQLYKTLYTTFHKYSQFYKTLHNSYITNNWAKLYTQVSQHITTLYTSAHNSTILLHQNHNYTQLYTTPQNFARLTKI